MRKIRKLGLFVILGVVICALIFIGISSLEAQNKGKKPNEPPGKPDKEEKPPPEEEANWAVRIPTKTEALNDDLMFYGMDAIDGYYENNDYITVSVKKNTMAGPWKKYFNFGYAFNFTLTNNKVGTGQTPDHFVGFEDLPLLTLVPDDTETPEDDGHPDADKPCCKFPGDACAEEDCYDCSPDCMAAFLNRTHPHAGGAGEEDYQYFWFRVNIFDQDIESMQVGPGYSYLFGGNPDTDREAGEPGDFLSIVARYQRDCYPEPAYHDVKLYRNINYWRAMRLGNPLNIEIERLNPTDYATKHGIVCEAVWRFRVLPEDYRDIDGFLKVKERYCTREKNRTKWYYPMEAKGNFSFYIDFIKNPTNTTNK